MNKILPDGLEVPWPYSKSPVETKWYVRGYRAFRDNTPTYERDVVVRILGYAIWRAYQGGYEAGRHAPAHGRPASVEEED